MTLTVDQLAAEVSVANRILVHHGILDAFGHVSARSPLDDDTFLMSRNLAPGLVEATDVVPHSFDGGAEGGHRLYLERFIHAEIYRARPDVMAVVHNHSPGVIPFGLTEARLEPVTHTAGFLAEGVGRFDTRDVFGDTDLLIRDTRMGEELARALGSGSVVLMRAHGAVVVGPSLKLATYRAVYAEVNARVQWQAMAIGGYSPLTDAEAAAADATNSGQIERLWGVWSAAVGR